ncbi:MAG: hypothetical protein OXI81_22510 [Paracoccaceae bacterium]|nr:hypothetical protein [Paracoccaceae bacterium]MDE2915447.1 hypothetical protein [Paracoccaceae bacterium]
MANAKVDQERNTHVDIPPRIRSFVYLVGTLGFPIIVAGYVLVSLSTDLRFVDRSLNQMAYRIDERPMSVERSIDMMLYVTEAMGHELEAGIGPLINQLNLTVSTNEVDMVKAINVVNRKIEGYVRPIVRRHKYFIGKFPSVAGNLGAYFHLSAPTEETTEGDTEAYLAAEARKDFGESLNALLVNNIAQFGDDRISSAHRISNNEEAAILALLTGEEIERDTPQFSETESDNSFEIIDRKLLLELSYGAVETAITALQDQAIEQIRRRGAGLQIVGEGGDSWLQRSPDSADQ